MRQGLGGVLGAAMLLAGIAAPVQAQGDGMTAAPRAGDTVLVCNDGGWDVPSGGCARRGGVRYTQVYGSGLTGGAQAAFSIVTPPLSDVTRCPSSFQAVTLPEDWRRPTGPDYNANTLACVQMGTTQFLVVDDQPVR